MKLIVFSGLDGAGKSTQIENLQNYLKKENKKTYIFWSRGGYTPIFEFLKKFLRILFRKHIPKAGFSNERKKAFSNNFIRNIWLYIAILDLIFFYSIYLRLKLFFGYYVICDRYLIDTEIDFKITFPSLDIKSWFLWKLLNATSIKPAYQFILVVSVNESKKRSIEKNEPFPDSIETLKIRLKEYTSIANNKTIFDLIFCEEPVDVIFNKILSRLKKFKI